MANDRMLLLCMTESVCRIGTYVASGRSPFLSSAIAQDAVLWNLYLLCSAASEVSGVCKATHREFGWERLGQIWSDMARDPWHVEPTTVWQWIERDLPAVRVGLAHIMRPTTGQYAV